jgi:hypothetical protein
MPSSPLSSAVAPDPSSPPPYQSFSGNLVRGHKLKASQWESPFRHRFAQIVPLLKGIAKPKPQPRLDSVSDSGLCHPNNRDPPKIPSPCAGRCAKPFSAGIAACQPEKNRQ